MRVCMLVTVGDGEGVGASGAGSAGGCELIRRWGLSPDFLREQQVLSRPPQPQDRHIMKCCVGSVFTFFIAYIKACEVGGKMPRTYLLIF